MHKLVICLIFAVLAFQYTIAVMGYGPEDKNTVLELTYNCGVTEYDKGNGYAQVNSSFTIYCCILVFEFEQCACNSW